MLDKEAMSLLPDDDDLDLIHTRRYETRVYRLSDDEILVRGAVSDTKPAGLYVPDDPEPLEIHQMQVELRVATAGLEIRSARVLFETHPHSRCPVIAADYEKLVGLSIARGFTRKIRDLFGGPNGCTHTNALLQAMAPAVVQSTWSLDIRRRRAAGIPQRAGASGERESLIRGQTNTCHVWDERGEHVAAARRGERLESLLPVVNRLAELGRDDPFWD